MVNSTETLIEVSHLSKQFGRIHAVCDLSFSLERGEVLGFLGPNGAGKTTAMRMIAGFLTPSNGTARVCGFDVAEEALSAKARMGYLPEGAPSYGEMSVQRFLEFIGKIRMPSPVRRTERINYVVQQVELGAVLQQTIETLSKGYRRRVALAQSLLHDPDVLIMDEPTDGLDPNQKHEVRHLIQRMAANKAIIISTHILEEVDAVCTRAIIIANGKLLFNGTPTELHQRSAGAGLDQIFREITLG